MGSKITKKRVFLYLWLHLKQFFLAWCGYQSSPFQAWWPFRASTLHVIGVLTDSVCVDTVDVMTLPPRPDWFMWEKPEEHPQRVWRGLEDPLKNWSRPINSWDPLQTDVGPIVEEESGCSTGFWFYHCFIIVWSHYHSGTVTLELQVLWLSALWKSGRHIIGVFSSVWPHECSHPTVFHSDKITALCFCSGQEMEKLSIWKETPPLFPGPNTFICSATFPQLHLFVQGSTQQKQPLYWTYDLW